MVCVLNGVAAAAAAALPIARTTRRKFQVSAGNFSSASHLYLYFICLLFSLGRDFLFTFLSLAVLALVHPRGLLSRRRDAACEHTLLIPSSSASSSSWRAFCAASAKSAGPLANERLVDANFDPEVVFGGVESSLGLT